MGSYALITPARNEESFIEQTILSVCSQTVKPKKWIIVSDGSTDRTEEIVNSYIINNEFICLISSSRLGKAGFGSKVKAFNEGYNRIKNLNYEYIGNLDADISFSPNYFKNILHEFEGNNNLGIAGGIIQEKIRGKRVDQCQSSNSVAGAVQIFRRNCYEEIGGYIPMEHGGVDAAVEIMARMYGWEVETFFEYKVLHHGKILTGAKNIIGARFYQGFTNYLLGYHQLFQLSSCFYNLAQHPFILGSLCSACGYYWARSRNYEQKLPKEAVKYLRTEQMGRLRLSMLARRRV